MKIVKCPKCSKYVHQAAQCLYCGNTVGFDTILAPTIHENVAYDYSRVDYLVESKKYDDALSLSHTVIVWMHDFAGIYWLRLLAKNQCSDAAELIRKGFNCEEDADFLNALEFSSGEERSAYQDIQAMVQAVQKALRTELLEHAYKCKMETDIMQIQARIKPEMERRRQQLFSLWHELEQTEQAMYMQEKDCILLSKEYSDTLNKSSLDASQLKTEVYRLEECTAEQLHKYHVKIGSLLQQSEQAMDALKSMRSEHPWVKSFQDLIQKRDEQVRLIDQELSSLKRYGATVQKTLDEIRRIEQQHQEAILAVDAFNFRSASDLLGSMTFNTVLHNICPGAGANH